MQRAAPKANPPKGGLAFLALFLFLASAPAADAVINVAPTNLTVCAGWPVVSPVDAKGDDLTYQWQVGAGRRR